MGLFVLRRLISSVLVLVTLTFITYAAVNEIPKNRACHIMVCLQSTTKAEKQAALHQAGLDQSIVSQYADFVWSVVRHGSLGLAANGQKLNPTIEAAIPPTASLVLGGMGLMFLLTVPLAAYAASFPRSPADRGVLSFSLIGIAVHPFVLGIGLHQAGVFLGLPKGRYCPLTHHAIPKQILAPGEGFVSGPGVPVVHACGGPADWAAHMVVPWVVFALFFMPLYLRMIRTRLLATLGEQYIITARAKGATERRVVIRHALRNAFGPLLPMIALDAGTALTAAIYIETVFGLPGLGQLAVVGLSGEFFQGVYDVHYITAIVFTVGLFVVALSIAADVASAWLDPRVRARNQRGLISLPRVLRRSAVA
jgi:peptide/nickel transport system permease protein